MLIYVNIKKKTTDRQTHQKYSSEPHKKQKGTTNDPLASIQHTQAIHATPHHQKTTRRVASLT